MKGVNKVILLGHVGNDPKNMTTPNGSAVCNFSLATSEEWKDKTTGQKESRTEWHRCTVFGKLAEIAASYVSKGSHLYLEGKLRTRKWDDNGTERYTTEIIVDELQMLGGGEQKPAKQKGGTNYPEPIADDFDDSIIPF